MESLGLGAVTTQGYATFVRQLASAVVIATFRQKVAGRPDFESSIQGRLSIIPILIAPFDNTNGFSTGMAIVNSDSVVAAYILTFYDAFGGLVSTDAVSLMPGQHVAFSSAARFVDTTNKVGVMRVARVTTTPNPYGTPLPYMALTVLRFNPTGASAVMPLYDLQLGF